VTSVYFRSIGQRSGLGLTLVCASEATALRHSTNVLLLLIWISPGGWPHNMSALDRHIFLASLLLNLTATGNQKSDVIDHLKKIPSTTFKG